MPPFHGLCSVRSHITLLLTYENYFPLTLPLGISDEKIVQWNKKNKLKTGYQTHVQCFVNLAEKFRILTVGDSVNGVLNDLLI